MSPHASHAIWIEEFAASYRDLLRFLRRRTRCEETARDLAQDAWLRVTERHTGSDAPPPTSPDHARAHIFVVAERLAIDHLRRQRHWNEELAPRLLAGPRHAPDVAEAHAYAQALRAVDGALAGMPARMREVFVAHRLDGVQHDELAQRYQVSRKTIEREVTKAMDIAQTALAGDTNRQGRRKTIGALLGLAGIGTSAGVAWQAWREWVPEWQTAFATQAGRIGHLPLPEGSELTLDADSAVDVRLMATRREVRLLRGGAFFSVARDPARPFIVQAGAARVTVLGTRFAVEMNAQGVHVAVESGRVLVQGTAGGETLELGPGDTARVGSSGAPAHTPPRPADAVAPWRNGWLDFEQTPLAEAAAQLNRYRPDTRVAVDPAVAALPVLARVNVARSTQWLHSLPAVLPVRVDAVAGGGVVIRPR